MAEKYSWLCRVVLDAAGPARPADLRAASRRWPGALRECQRTHPQRYRERSEAVAASCTQEARSRAEWRGRGLAAVCLWSELHRLHADVLDWRRTRPPRSDAVSFLRDLTGRDPERRRMWPSDEIVAAWGPVGVGVALAERSLARRAGVTRDALRRELLDER